MIGFLSAKIWASIIGIGVLAAAGFYIVHLIEQNALAQAEIDGYKLVQKHQMAVNQGAREHAESLEAINTTLAADLKQLRDRPPRIIETARADCQGSTGAELSRKDAEFLTREAARADRIRAGLMTCYSYADLLQDD
ncbi:Bacteriophage lysis protein [uncultured Thiomicrorhabdus sp.]